MWAPLETYDRHLTKGVTVTDKLVITVVQPEGAGSMLSVEDAMTQVLSAVRLLKKADPGDPTDLDEGIEWLLESASTNSPLRVVAIPYSRNAKSLGRRVATATKRFRRATRGHLTTDDSREWWDKEAEQLLRTVIGDRPGLSAEVRMDFGDGHVEDLRSHKIDAVSMLATMNPVAVVVPAKVAQGEIEGRLVSAGTYYSHPALQLQTRLYGEVQCVIPDSMIDRFGQQHTLNEVWRERRVAITGRMHYAEGGKLIKVDVIDVRGINTKSISLSELQDSEFAAGLSPVEFMGKRRDGEI